MVLVNIQALQQGDAAPASAENNELWLVFLCLLLRALVIVDVILRDGEVLGSTTARAQCQLRDGNVDRFRVFVVGGSIEDEESEDQTAGDHDEDAQPCQGSIYAPDNPRRWSRRAISRSEADLSQYKVASAGLAVYSTKQWSLGQARPCLRIGG